jgi:uncharacterized protein
VNKELEDIYSKIPAIDCQGLCYDQCTLIIAHPVELDNIGLDPHFKTLDDGKVLVHLIKQDWNDSDGCLTCPMLKDNKCSIYDKRPLICRLYGVVENMKCRFGCKPTRYLTNKEGVALVSAVKKLEVGSWKLEVGSWKLEVGS